MSLFPLVSFDRISLFQANVALDAWGHRMGPYTRPVEYGCWTHAVLHNGSIEAVAITGALVRERVGGGLGHLTRENCLELARLCASRPGLCRVALRLWREYVFPGLSVPVVISYQDADLHNGNTYRFDGWERIGYCPSGGSDPRSGRKGRNRWVCAWPRGASAQLAMERAA